MTLSHLVPRRSSEWKLRTTSLSTDDHSLIMGILNVTPDSFSDGGADVGTAAAVARGLAMWHAGADIVDVGGESTRPGAAPVAAAEEMERVIPVVGALAGDGVVVSIDTMKPDVAAAAVGAGAQAVNDVGGLRDPAMREVVAELACGVVVMHMRGDPATMQDNTDYGDLISDVAGYLEQQSAAAVASGIEAARICIDPGIGFGKTHDQNLQLLDNVSRFVELGFPVLIGASRKGFLGSILRAAGIETEAAERDYATAATVVAAISGGAAVVRVHEVAAALQVVRTTDAIVRGRFGDGNIVGRT